jgi:hypothetical protein
MAVADFRDLLSGKLEVAHSIIEQDEIVSGPVHFAETQHGGWLPQSGGKAKLATARKARRGSSKHQAPSSREAPIPKLQPAQEVGWCLELDVSLVLGASPGCRNKNRVLFVTA